jgi:hypothetical protein
MENEKIIGLGKIYEKYLLLKRNAHTLQIACAFDKVTQESCFFIVSQEVVGDDVRMIPIGKLYMDDTVEKEIEPYFEESAMAQVIFNQYEENDERFTIEEIDENTLDFDKQYNTMGEMFKHGVKICSDIKEFGFTEEDLE